MRAGIDGFRVEPRFVLADARVLALDPESAWGLVRLLAACWAAGGRLSTDPEQLAALSGLGDRYASSKLAVRLDAFFYADGDGLASLDLEGQLQHRQKVSEARRAAGAAGGSKRQAIAKQLPSNCLAIASPLPAGGERQTQQAVARVRVTVSPECPTPPPAGVRHGSVSSENPPRSTPCARKDKADDVSPPIPP